MNSGSAEKKKIGICMKKGQNTPKKNPEKARNARII